MDWRLKALAFRALDFPGGDHLHFWLQRYVTGGWPRPDKRLSSFPPRAQRVVDDCVKYQGALPNSVLEIGAGRDLALPLSLRELGVSQVLASDVERLAKLDLVQHAADRLLAQKVKFSSWGDLRQLGIEYRAPHRLGPNDPAVDCSCSNEVLEHVPPDELVDLLKALRAVTHGITTHSIDYSDHYARSDSNVSRFNFLRYSDAEWRPFNSGRQYVNRLRHSDYLRLFREAGFQIVEESSLPGEAPADVIDGIAPQFRHYETNDLFALKGRIVAI